MKGPVSAREEFDKAAWKRSESADHAMGLLTMELFKHLPGLLGTNTLYVLEYDKLFEWNTVQQSCFTAPALPLMLATSGNESAHPLRDDRPGRSPAEIKELDNKGYVVREKTSLEVEVCLKESPSLVYGEGELTDSKLKEVGSEKRNLSSSMTSTGNQGSKTATRSGGSRKTACRKMKLKRWE